MLSLCAEYSAEQALNFDLNCIQGFVNVMYEVSAGVAEVGVQQGEDSGLICTSDEGAIVRCSLAQTEDPL